MLRLCYPALTAAALHAVLLGVYLTAANGDPAVFTCVAKYRYDKFPYEHVHFGCGYDGYDGQFYYALARAPFAQHTAGFDFDSPAKRQLRICYPLVCWMLTGGDPVRLLWALPLVNLFAIAGLAWLGALVAARCGLSPWWGVLLPLAVNAGMPALRDLTDTFAIFTLAALLVAWLLRGPWWVVALCGAAAVFSREQNTAPVAIVFVCAAWRRQWWTCAGLAAVLALWFGWVGWLWETYHDTPFLPRKDNFDWPFFGQFQLITHLGATWQVVGRNLICLLLLALQTGLALDLLRRQEVEPAIRGTALFVVGLMLVGGSAIYIEWWSFGRVYAGLPLAVWLGCVQRRLLWPLPLLAAYLLVQGELVFLDALGFPY